jgi:hypothetical protein
VSEEKERLLREREYNVPDDLADEWRRLIRKTTGGRKITGEVIANVNEGGRPRKIRTREVVKTAE